LEQDRAVLVGDGRAELADRLVGLERQHLDLRGQRVAEIRRGQILERLTHEDRAGAGKIHRDERVEHAGSDPALGDETAEPGALREDAPPAEIIAAAASMIRDQLGLPFSPAYKAYVCSDEAAFTEGLLRHLSVRAVGSDWRVVPAAVGIATPVGVFFRGDYLARTAPRRRVTLVAHELAHLCQQDLAKHREDRLPVWLVEGHADWVAYQVLDLLGLQ